MTVCVRVLGSIGEWLVGAMRVPELVILLDVDGPAVVTSVISLNAKALATFSNGKIGMNNGVVINMVSIMPMTMSLDGSLVDNCI